MSKKTLICMAYHQTDSTYFNLLYFLNHGIVQHHGGDCYEYIVVVNGKCTAPIPNHVRVIHRPNVGFDFGAHAAGIDAVDVDAYDFFIFMNASVIGPILSLEYPDDYDWVQMFRKSFFRNDIGLLGTTIVCLPPTDAGGYGPRVEGFFWATDRPGLDAIRAEKTILCQHRDKYSAIVNGEYGLSRCILRHGRNLGCMLQRYNDIDWRDPKNWNHNGNVHPSRRGSYFGTSIDPYEVVFHKWHWHNMPTVNLEKVHQHVREKNRRHLASFDKDAYRRTNADLQHMNDQSLLDHFLLYGFHEGRVSNE